MNKKVLHTVPPSDIVLTVGRIIASCSLTVLSTVPPPLNSVRARKRGWAMSEKTTLPESFIKSANGIFTTIGKNHTAVLPTVFFSEKSEVCAGVYCFVEKRGVRV
jgi:hypothetical protein